MNSLIHENNSFTEDINSSEPITRLGCVSFLNTKPLIHGLTLYPSIKIRLAPPSQLLHWLEDQQVDMALCPVIDYQLSTQDLQVIPVGGIACAGRTLTVRLFSKRPFDQIKVVHTDMDSHTSIRLMRVILAERYGVIPELKPLDWPHLDDDLQAMLLIGDKVVVSEPDAMIFDHQLDLGSAWHALTGLPFVFAIWQARLGTELHKTPGQLSQTLEKNLIQLADIVDQYAESMSWPKEIAHLYLGRLLEYRMTPDHLKAINLFWSKCYDLGLIPQLKPMRTYGIDGVVNTHA